MRHVVVIPGGSANGRRVAGLMLQGFRAKGRTARLLEGPGVADPPFALDELPWFYGIKEDTAPLLRARKNRGLPWCYVDNPFFGRGGHWRVAVSAEQPISMGPDASVWRARGDQRFRAFDVAIAPWRTRGEHLAVLLCCQSPKWYAVRGTTLEDWAAATTAEIARHTRRKVVLRAKPKDPLAPARPLAEDLAQAAAVVSWSSNAGVEAILAGVPAFSTAPSAVSPMSYTDGLDRARLDHIETPREPSYAERCDWAAWLACNQWSAGELASGAFLDDLRIRLPE